MRASVHYERLEAKLLPEIKSLAERAALANQITLTDYIVKLIINDAPKALKAYTEIKVTNAQFDKFLEFSKGDRKPSEEIKEAANLLDTEGF